MNHSMSPPDAQAPRSEWARYYCGVQAAALTWIPPAGKAPRHVGWNQPSGYLTDPDQAAEHWRIHPHHNLGLVLGPSGIATFDLDQLAWSRIALAAVGLDLEALLKLGAAWEGNPQKAKRVFALPSDSDLRLRKLIWPNPDDPEEPVTVLELRAGPVQDVLPPSTHPDTRRPYRWLPGRTPWELGGYPPLPEELLNLWRRWDELLPILEEACSWRAPATASPQSERSGKVIASSDWNAVRAEVLQRIDLPTLVERLGAQPRGGRSYLCPFHPERSPSFWIFDTGRGWSRWICAHGAAPVGRQTAQGWSCGDALDLVAHQRGLSVGKVTAELAKELEVPLPALHLEAGLPEPPPAETSTANLDPVGADGEADPLPLPIHAVEPFPVEAFPRPLQQMIREAAQALPCPEDFLGVPLLAVMGAAIGTSRSIQVKTGWREGPRIYSGIVAEPGSKKSPALDLVLAPVMRRQLLLKEQYSAEKERWLQDLGAYELALAVWKEEVRKAAKGSGSVDEMPLKPEEPVMAQLVASDATLEAVAQLLADNSRGLLFYRDELTGWVKSMDAYRGGKGADRQAWLTFWNGGSYMVNRKSAKEPLVLTNPFVSVTGCLPPAVLGDLSDERGREDGFIHRVLLVYPDSVPLVWNEDTIRDTTLRVYDQLLNKLWQLCPGRDGEGQEFAQLLTFTPAAKVLWVEWIQDHYRNQHDPFFPVNLRGPWAKLEGYCARFALILQMGRVACEEARDGEIDEISMAGAAALAEYFKSHARRVYSRLHATEQDQNAIQAVAWLQKRGGSATARDLQRANVAGVNTAEAALALLRTLERRGYGSLVANGKKRWLFTLNSLPDTRQIS